MFPKIFTRPKLTVQTIPRLVVRAGVVGEFLRNVGLDTLSDTAIRNLQQAVTEGLIAKITITGVDAQGHPLDRAWVKLNDLGDDTLVTVEKSDGMSMTEACDVGLASAMSTAVKIMRRKQLTPKLSVEYATAALTNRTRLDEAARRLNLPDVPPAPVIPRSTPTSTPSYPSSSPFGTALPPFPAPSFTPTPTAAPPAPPPPPLAPPPPPAGYAMRTYLTLQPAKDPGLEFGMDALRKLR